MDLYCDHQKALPDVQVTRFLGKEEGRLVLFSDASHMAQAAAAYWVTEAQPSSEEPYQARLIASKLKLTGLRQMEHIGRLELIAAVMSVMLAVKICIAYGFPMDKGCVLYRFHGSVVLAVNHSTLVSLFCQDL